MKSVYHDLVSRVMRMPGIRGVLVVAVRDGLVVDGRVYVDVRADAAAALVASLYRRACRATGAQDGQSRFVELETDEGRIMIAGQSELALMAVVERRANLGQARLSVQRAAEELENMKGRV